MIARGRAEALVEMLDFLVAFTGNHTDGNWKILDERIDLS